MLTFAADATNSSYDRILSKMDVAIVTHVFATGPAQELEEYLKQKKVNRLTFLGHPFIYAREKRSFKKDYRNGNQFSLVYSFHWKLPESLNYLKDFVYTLWWLLTSKRKYHLYVGADSLNALCGLILRKLGLVQSVAFYSVDVVPSRFGNRVLNTIYHRIEGICVTYCDRVWNLSNRMIIAREQMHIARTGSGKQIEVPIGVYYDRIRRFSLDQIDRFRLVYMGHLREGQGLGLIFEALPDIFKTWPQVSLVVIGTGPLESALKERAQKIGNGNRIEFKGYVEDHRIVEQILSKCGVGLALYEPDPDSFTWYADPSKPKQYMACGLPVVITSVPAISQVVQKENAGVLVNYDKSDMMRGLHTLLDDQLEYARKRKNAIQLAARYDWGIIFRKTLSDLMIQNRRESESTPKRTFE
jgi:glycosyltransferase involved in cell wall biosynthesis